MPPAQGSGLLLGRVQTCLTVFSSSVRTVGGMTTSPEGKALARRRHHARLAMLKKRTTIASVLGFAALLGLVTQHAVKGASGATATTAQRSSRSATRATSFFDAGAGGFAFDEGSTSTESAPPAATSPPPVAQSSVS